MNRMTENAELFFMHHCLRLQTVPRAEREAIVMRMAKRQARRAKLLRAYLADKPTLEGDTLELTLQRGPFDRIARGVKRLELREPKEWSYRRLIEFDPSVDAQFPFKFRPYQTVHFRNGYEPDSATMTVEFLGTVLRLFERKGRDQEEFAIRLGKITEIKNWDGPLTAERERREAELTS